MVDLGFELYWSAKFIITIVAGYIIGVVSSLLGVAGGELIIPTIVLIYGVDIKLAGTLSLIVSIPTILISLYKHYQNHKLSVIKENFSFINLMIIGSIAGSYIGSLAVDVIDSAMIEIILAILLFISAVKMKLFRSKNT